MSLFARISRFVDSFRADWMRNQYEAVQPRVTPDPLHAAELAKRLGELTYVPENGFAKDTQVRKADVLLFRRRA